ncbi:MAG: YCF48-related protein [Terriglobia bacterium]
MGFRSIRFVDEQNGWLSGSRGVFCSNDGGKNWKRLSAIIGDSGFKENPSRGLRLEPGRILWVSAKRALIRGQKGIIDCNCDNDEWTEANDSTYLTLARVAFINYDQGWAVSGEGNLYYTKDQGNKWQSMTYVFETGLIRDLVATAAKELWAISQGGSVFHTVDGGISWSNKKLPGIYNILTSIYFYNLDVGWILNLRGSIYATINRGETWVVILDKSEVPIYTLFDLTFINGEEGWVLGAPQENSLKSFGNGMFIYHTKNGGKKWEIQLKDNKDFLISIHALPNGTVWVAGYHGTVMKSTDNGKNWRNVKVD